MKIMNNSASGYPHFNVVQMSRQMGKRHKLEKLTQIHLQLANLEKLLVSYQTTQGAIN